MPGNLAQPTVTAVLPASLSTAFIESREYAQLRSAYHDGTIQRSQLAQTSRRTFKLSMRLSATLPVSAPALAALYAFWVAQNGGLTPFYFYNPFEPASGQAVGGNYDATGVSTQGRYTVVFRGSAWTQATDVCRTSVAGLELVEVA
jgi:hypothetical protein